jgi:hypothetical protein
VENGSTATISFLKSPFRPLKTSQPKHPSGVCLVGDYISTMRERGNIRNWALASLTLYACAGANAVTPDSSPNQYGSITNRNLFALNPAPPPPKVEQPAPVLPKLTLNGITTILGRNLAIMKALFPGKPGEPAREQSYILSEGQRDGDIEVLEVDEQAGSVTVNNFGTVMTITFDKESVKPVTPAPGVQSNPAGAIPGRTPAANPPTPTGNFNTGKRPFPMRNPASTGLIPSPITNTGNATLLPSVTPPLPTNAQPQAAAQERLMTPEEQIALRELEREAAREHLENGALPGAPASAPPPVPAPPATELAPQ